MRVPSLRLDMLIDALNELDRQLDISVASELCLPSQPKYELLKGLLKRLFEASVKASERKIGSVVELVIEGLDSETIWEEIQTRNRPLLRYLNSNLKRLKDRLKARPAIGSEDEDEESEVEGSEEDADSAADDEDELGDSEEEEDEQAAGGGDGSEKPDLTAEEEVDYLEAFMEEVEEMENKYVDRLKRKGAEDGHRGYTEDDDEDEEFDFDLAEKGLYEDMDEDVDEDAAKACYKDFFGKSRPLMKVKEEEVKDPRNAFTDLMEEVDEEDEFQLGESTNDQDEQSADEENLTSFQKQQRKLKREMAEIEKDLVAQKSWELRGEVRASDRPENSLLEVYVDVEKASKPAPIVTQEYTNTLEDMITRRITEQKFDDVIPKLAPVEETVADLPEVSQEKSQEGLADVCDLRSNRCHDLNTDVDIRRGVLGPRCQYK